MILHPKFIDAMKQVKAAQTQPQPKPGVQGQEKDIKMSRAQFELFARRTCEWGIIPGAVYKEKAEFMKKLEEQRAGLWRRYTVSRTGTKFLFRIPRRISIS